jgi:hypothetical protein
MISFLYGLVFNKFESARSVQSGPCSDKPNHEMPAFGWRFVDNFVPYSNCTSPLPPYIHSQITMKLRIFIISCIVLTLSSAAYARTWTSTTGKTLEADLVRIQSGKAYLRFGKKIAPLPISGLSKKDQIYIKNWITEQKMAQLSSELGEITTDQEAEQAAAEAMVLSTPIDGGVTDKEHPKSLDHIKRTIKAIQDRRGDSTDRELQGAINNLNSYRFICGLDFAVTLDASYNQSCTAAAQICNAIGKLSHGPDNPGWEEDRYQEARKGCGRSNLSMGSSVSGSVHSYMNDSDPGNITALGHRRWCLNPTMGKTGFGSDDRYSAMWSMDRSNSDPGEIDFIAFPTPGYMPTDYFKPHYAWSVTLHKSAYKIPDSLTAANVKVYKIRSNETRPRPGDQPLELNYFNYDRAGFGIANCIIFRPDGIDVEHRDRYWVEIDGVEKQNGINTTIEYLVDFTRI